MPVTLPPRRRALGSSYGSACPHLRAPGALRPDGRTIRHDLEGRSRTLAPRISYWLIIRWNASCARSEGAPVLSARSRTASRRSTLPRPGYATSQAPPQTLSEHRAAEGAGYERCHHRVSQCGAPLSPKPMCERLWTPPMCEKLWTIPRLRRAAISVQRRGYKGSPIAGDNHCGTYCPAAPICFAMISDAVRLPARFQWESFGL